MTDTLRDRAHALRLYGLIAHWDEIGECGWLPTLIAWEEEERRSRSLKRRLSSCVGPSRPAAGSDDPASGRSYRGCLSTERKTAL